MLRLRDTIHSRPRHELPALFRPIVDRLRSGRLLIRPVRRVPLSALPEALRDTSGPGGGKVLVDCQQ